MPHLVILYTAQLDAQTDMRVLCRKLADTMIALRDEAGSAVFPVGGVRVLAYPAAHHAVADGSGDHAFAYFNLRMARGRSDDVKRRAGENLVATAREHLAPLLATRAVGLTLQVDEGPEVFDGKFGNLHALFAPKP
jgi:5-carboxymethyl-2-hydroxymuconate isomerase